MRKKLISVLMVFVMTFACAACNNAGGAAQNAAPGGSTATQTDSDTQQLEILKSGKKLSQDQLLSRIKAEYLIENNGYSDDDNIVAILSLGGNSLMDYYAQTDYSAAGSVAEYALTANGKREAAAISSQQQGLINMLYREELISGVEYTYTAVANAVAVSTTYGNFKKIENLCGTYITRASLADTFNLPQASEVEDASAIVNAVEVYSTGIYDPSAVTFTGKGTTVAILDSGFELSHSVFNTRSMDKESLAFDESYISGKLAAEEEVMKAKETSPGLRLSDVYYSDKIPFKYDYADKDEDVFPHNSEHGTHVAGIIGGWDESRGHKGVAPDTQLVLMKVFPDVGDGAETDDILAALEDSVLLGVDAINMSLGTSCGFAREPDGDVINDVYDKIEAAGISLLTAASNSYSSSFGGEQGNTNFVTNPDSGTVGSPSTYKASLSVASISGTKSKYLVANNKDVIFFDESNNIAGEPNNFFDELYEDLGKDPEEEVTLEYVVIPGVGRGADFASLREGELVGKIALIKRGDTTFEEKAQRAQSAGAAGCIIYNNIDGDILMSMGKSDHIPTVSISKDDGTLLAEANNGLGGTLTFKYTHEAGPFMSDFSSWGPLPDLSLKPEITAHGGNIRSSVPGNEFEELSGTSMATPNLCGLTLLIRQYVKENFSTKADGSARTPKELSALTYQLMMSTAGIVLNEEGVPYSPRKQGAGLASIGSIANTRAILTVDGSDRTKLELKDDPKKQGVYKMEFNVVNLSRDNLTYDLSLLGMTESVSTSDSTHVSETGRLLNGTFTATGTGDGTVADNKVSVTAGGTVKLTVTYTLTQADKDLIERLFPNGMYVEGFVKLTAVDDNDGNDKNDVNLNIPFLAFYGDWTQAPLFDKTYYEVEAEAHDGSLDEEDKLKADYYATTPYGSYYNNYIIPLGTYLYTVDANYDEIPATEDHIAISNIYGAIDGIYSVYAGLLRDAKRVIYTITDKVTGEVMYTHVKDNALKAFSQGGGPIPNYEELRMSTYQQGLVNNRQYEFKMEAYLDYNLQYDSDGNIIGGGGATTNIRNTFSFDFYVDNESPLLKSAVFEKEYDRSLRKNRYYINLEVYDNHYVQSIQPVRFIDTDDPQNWYTVLTPTAIPVYGDRNSSTTVRFEITDYLNDLPYDEFLNSSLGFIIDDYALNPEIFYVMVPGTDLSAADSNLSFTADGTVGGGRLSRQEIKVGDVLDLTQYLASTDLPADGTRDYLKYLSWESSNPAVAKVQGGQVLGVSQGLTQITVRHQYYTNYSASVRVQVTGTPASETPDLNLESVRFTYFDTLFAHPRASGSSDLGETGGKQFITSIQGSLNMYPGEKIKLHYEINPWYEGERCVATFESTNPARVKIEEDGTITALSEGSSTIRLRIDGSTLTASLRISVQSPFVIDEARTLEGYKGVDETVEIPDDEGILYIGPYSFSLYDIDNDIVIGDDDFYANRIAIGNPYIKKVIIPEGVQEIQRHAFYNCYNLEEVVLPSSIKFIAQDAFNGCVRLNKINLNGKLDPEKGDGKENTVWVQAIGDRAFYNCKALDNIDLSKTYAIGAYAFAGCTSLSQADLTGLRNAGTGAFSGCTSLTSVTFDSDGHTKLSVNMFSGAGLNDVTVYEKVNIPSGCFANNANLQTLTFGAVPQYISEEAFKNCSSLQTLTLPNGKVQIEDFAFAGCGKVGKLVLQPNTYISAADLQYGGSVFAGTKITSFEVQSGNSLYKASADGKLLLDASGSTVILAATGATFGDYTLPGDGSAITKIGKGAFAGADISSLTITSKDFVIGDYAFADCVNLTSVTFPAEAGNLVVGDYAFAATVRNGNELAYPSKLATLTNLQNVKNIGKYAFSHTAVSNAVIGDNARLGEGAFFNSALTEVTIGANANLGFGAFQRCTRLVTVHMPETDVEMGTDVFSYDTSLKDIDLSHLTHIAAATFYGCTSLATAQLTNAVTVGNSAFAMCSSLGNVTMPKVEEIGAFAFSGDYSRILNQENPASSGGLPIASLYLPETLKTMGEAAFLGAYNLSAITFAPDMTLAEIPGYAFTSCTALASVQLPASVKKIGDYAFAANLALAQINLGGVEEIGGYAFISCEILLNADLTSAKTVGDAAFASCLGLQGEITADNLTEIGHYAFQGTGITKFNAPAAEYIGVAAFQFSALTEFVFGDKIAYVGEAAFDECRALTSYYFGTDKKTTGKINDYALLDNGALYTYIDGGNLQLNSYPAGNTAATMEVKEGTYRIGDYAGSSNPHVVNIVLPDSLRVIADYAFFGYTALNTVQFKSSVAPTLESHYDSTAALPETAPGYGLLHSSLHGGRYTDGTIAITQVTYYNFVDLVGSIRPITMILPANENLSGYDSLIYEAYFGKVENAQRSDYVAMENTMRTFIDAAGKIKGIDKVTSAHQKLIEDAVTALNAVTQDPTKYGYTQEEWQGLVDMVNAKYDELKQFKLSNASRTAREIQARIDALPDSYDGSAEQEQIYRQLNRDINLLTRTDRESLDLTHFNAYRASYESYNPGGSTVDPGEDTPGGDNPTQPEAPVGGSGCGGCGSTTIDGGLTLGGTAAVIMISMLAVAHFIRKKRNNQ